MHILYVIIALYYIIAIIEFTKSSHKLNNNINDQSS